MLPPRVYLGLSKCLSVWHNEKPHVHTSQKFIYVLPLAMGQSFCDDSATGYVLAFFVAKINPVFT